MGHTVGATGQQGMLTPPRHLIPPPVYPGVRVNPFAYLTFNSYLNFETDYSSVSWPYDYVNCVTNINPNFYVHVYYRNCTMINGYLNTVW
jgi:hypothetical protein